MSANPIKTRFPDISPASPEFPDLGNQSTLAAMQALTPKQGEAIERIRGICKMYGDMGIKTITVSTIIEKLSQYVNLLQEIPTKSAEILDVIALGESFLPESAKTVVYEPLQTPLLHSIMVQGSYADNPEFVAAKPTRVSFAAAGWRDLVWVYQQNQAIADTVGPQKVFLDPEKKYAVEEVSFRDAILSWEEAPEWVGKFIPILDVLYEKKGYVAMADIMKMIIEYYAGGLYVDIKIQFPTVPAMFLATPLVPKGALALPTVGTVFENWAILTQKGCQMIAEIMETTLTLIPPPWVLAQMPENYIGGEYSQAHKELHEERGPWTVMKQHFGTTRSMAERNPDLLPQNPHGTSHSWDKTDLKHFDWEKHSKAWPMDVVPVPDGASLSGPEFWVVYEARRRDYPAGVYCLSLLDAQALEEKANPFGFHPELNMSRPAYQTFLAAHPGYTGEEKTGSS